jgi:hypothetical protein
MKKHIVSLVGRSLIFFSLIFSLFSCQQDLQEPIIHPQSTLNDDIKSTKIWFENYQNTISMSSKFKNMEIQWDKATVIGNVVEVPFMIDGKFNVPSMYDNLTHFGKQRLVIYNRNQESRVAYVIDYMPSETFPKNIADINALNFRDKKFDGIVAAHTFNEENVNGYVWNNGELIKKIQTKSNGVVLRGCSFSTYLYACGHVMDGPLQCSMGVMITCWDDRIDTGGGTGGSNTGGCQDFWCNGNSGNGGGVSYCNGHPCTPCELDPMLPECRSNLVESIVNELTGCRATLLSNLLTQNTQAEINSYLSLYSSSTSSTVTYKEENTGICDRAGIARCNVPNGSCIALNTFALQYSSQEKITATILHELLHIYLRLDAPRTYTSNEQHAAMAGNYVNLLKTSLMRVFPNLSDEDATALSWGGLDKEDYISVMNNGLIGTQLPRMVLESQFSTMMGIVSDHTNCNNNSCKKDSAGNCIGPSKGTACN